MKKKIFNLFTVTLLAVLFVCSMPTAYAAGDFVLELSADKTYALEVGDTVKVTVTPRSITHREGLCSYDAQGITFDADVLSFDSQDISVAHSDFKAFASETEKGKISVMVVDYSDDGRQLHDGECALTLNFKVIAKTEKTSISLSEAVINGTVANAALDSCPGEAGEALWLGFGDSPVSAPDSQVSSGTGTDTSAASDFPSKDEGESAASIGDGTEKTASSKTMWIVLVAAAVVCVAAGIIFIAVKKRKD